MELVRETAEALVAEATRTNERRMLVLAGRRTAGYEAARIAAKSCSTQPTTLSEHEIVGDRVDPRRADELLGRTIECVVVDCHDACRPNALGRAVGTVDGGGLLVLVAPDLDRWPHRRDSFDETLAVAPFDLDDVSGHFRARLVRTLRHHRGIAIVDVDDDRVVDDGLTNPAPQRIDAPSLDHSPPETTFPDAIYRDCLTRDQYDAVYACEMITDGEAVVLEADRGRGKSSAAGLAAAGFAIEGRDVLVTAPGYRNVVELFSRAVDRLSELDELAADDRDGEITPTVSARSGGRIRFSSPVDALEDTADVLFVDEAAGLPVRVLEGLLEVAPRCCFATTIHGYEGAGRGFDVRFRARLEDVRSVETVSLDEPIRYAAGDPIEVWQFRALLLDARPAVDQLVAGATPTTAEYVRFDSITLAADEHRLREVFGLLVSAHYRTEPNDLARLLDAPNVETRALLADDHVVAVAMCACEGGLDEESRRRVYEGNRIRGHMLPDVLTSQLRDPVGGEPTGVRIVRIATHDAVRSRGLGSKLLEAIRREVATEGDPPIDFDGIDSPVDWLGTGYGATPELLSFWTSCGYAPIHLSTTRNESSGEHSVLMLFPQSDPGRKLLDRHGQWFCARILDVLGGPLSDADPDVVRLTLRAARCDPDVSLSPTEWRTVASAAYGPGLYDVAPGPFRRLALRALVEGAFDDPATERLLVRKALQARPWRDVVDDLGYVSKRECMRALGAAYRPLVDRYGTDAALAEADRYR